MRPIFLFAFTLFFISCSEPQKADFILTDVTILDIENGSVIPEQLVALSGDSILAVDKASALGDYSSEYIVSLEGRYVMPGLWDNHVHFRGGEELTEANKALLPLYLNFGVTTVRDGGGDITPALQKWQKEINAGNLDGPAIFTPGPKLDGSNPSWEGSLKVLNDQDARTALDSLDHIHADFVKMYDGNLTADAFYAIIREAEQRGYKTTGHMPLSADLMTAVKLGLDGTEHLYYLLTETSPIADSLREAASGYRMISPLMQSYDEELAGEVYAKLGEEDFYVTPTLHVGKTLAEILIADHSEDSLLNYIKPEIQDTYKRRLNSAERGGEAYTRQRTFWVESFRKMVKPMYDAGINVLAGSDCGPFNSFTYPGESIHKELELLVEAGLTPQQALITSVIHGPEFFGLEQDYGSIGPGKKADLLILEANPLDNIENTTSIFSVVAAGKWYSRSTLDELMQSIRN